MSRESGKPVFRKGHANAQEPRARPDSTKSGCACDIASRLGRAMLRTMDIPQAAKTRRRVRALLLSDRIDTANLEHDGVVSMAPLTFKYGADGLVTLFRYGVAVLMGLSAAEEDQVLSDLRPRLIRPVAPSEEESVQVAIIPDKDDQILPGGPIALKMLTSG